MSDRELQRREWNASSSLPLLTPGGWVVRVGKWSGAAELLLLMLGRVGMAWYGTAGVSLYIRFVPGGAANTLFLVSLWGVSTPLPPSQERALWGYGRQADASHHYYTAEADAVGWIFRPLLDWSFAESFPTLGPSGANLRLNGYPTHQLPPPPTHHPRPVFLQ